MEKMSARKMPIYRIRRMIAAVIAVLGLVGLVITHPDSYEKIIGAKETDAESVEAGSSVDSSSTILATSILEKLEVKGRAPKTGYTREEFYDGWPEIEGCSLRQRIIRREVGETAVLADNQCTVIEGEYVEPYTGQTLSFNSREEFSKGVQIDHVVALSDAWQKGAQRLTKDERYNLATDPLNLLAVESAANQQKSDGDAATWLPKNKSFRCQYVARQISVKYKHHLWVTEAEKAAMGRILETCPNEPAVGTEQ